MAETSITAVDYVERILITLNPDGSIKGAAQYRLHRVLNADGSPYMPDKQGDAEALSEPDLQKVLPDKSSLMAQVDALGNEIDSMKSKLAEEVAARSSAEATLADVQRALSAAGRK